MEFGLFRTMWTVRNRGVCRKHSWTLPEHVYIYCYITENCFVCIAQCDISDFPVKRDL